VISNGKKNAIVKCGVYCPSFELPEALFQACLRAIVHRRDRGNSRVDLPAYCASEQTLRFRFLSLTLRFATGAGSLDT
jgi:hypothetical protein